MSNGGKPQPFRCPLHARASISYVDPISGMKHYACPVCLADWRAAMKRALERRKPTLFEGLPASP